MTHHQNITTPAARGAKGSMTMLIDIENLSPEALKNIIASKGALDAALRRRASAQEEIDRCKANLRGLGVGIDGEMPANPEPRGVVANGGGVIPARNPVTGRTRKPRDTKPRGGIRLEPAVVASVRQALEAASGPRTTAELVEATELRAPVVIAACREIGATQVAKGRGTKWDIPRAPIPADDTAAVWDVTSADGLDDDEPAPFDDEDRMLLRCGGVPAAADDDEPAQGDLLDDGDEG